MTVNYDAIGRMSSTMFAGATDRTYSYVAGHSDNLLSSMTDALGGNTWTYDAAGRVLTQKQTVYGVTRTVTVARDTLGRPTSITYPSGMVVGISYGADVVTSLTVNSTTLLNNVSYIPQSGVATGWRWGNGTGYSRALDADGRVASVTLGSIQRSYGFDAAGRITTQTDTGSFGTRQSTYAYDEAGQLTSYAPATGSGQSFAYDTNGNRRSQVVNGVASNSSYAANTNRLSSWYGGAMQYNADGSPSSGPGGNYYYDSYGRLGSITNSSNQAFYNYNGLGQRVLKRLSIYVECGTPAAVKPVATGLSKANPTPAAAVSSTCNHWPVVNTVRYMYDFNGHIIGEYDSVTGYSQETVWFNGQPVATVQGGKVYYINADNLGTPRSIVRASDNVELWRWDSDPFGTTYPTAPNPSSGSLVYNLRFPGQVYDSETGFHYNGMRDYVPSTGRYLEPDPIGLAGGLSRYAYVGANPLKGADPLGEAGVENVVGAVAGAVGGGVVNGLNYYSQGCSFGKGFVNGAIGGTVGGFIFPSSPTTGGALGSGLTQVLNRLDGVSAFSNPVADIAFASVLGAVFSWAGTASGTAAAPTSSSLAAAIGALTSSSNANTGNIWANVGSTIGGTTPPSCHK